MLDIDELRDAVARIKPDADSIDEFQDWFTLNSGSGIVDGEVDPLVDAVEQIESRYFFEGMTPDEYVWALRMIVEQR